MKRSIFTLTLLFSTVIAFSQDSGEARALLDKVYADYIASEGIKLSFTSTTREADATVYEPQSGEAFVRGNKFSLHMDAMNIWFDGITQWVLLKDVNEVNISNPTESELASISPLAILGIYKKGYTLKAPLSQTVNGKEVYVIDMVPANDQKDVKAISVAIDKSGNRLVQVIITMSNDTQTKIDITNYNAHNRFSDPDFSFNKAEYPGVEIVDLR